MSESSSDSDSDKENEGDDVVKKSDLNEPAGSDEDKKNI
jgi:hypothetical protein